MSFDIASIRALEESVILFYRSQATEQATAHEWLTRAQTSPQAWAFVWELMQPGKPCEVQFFGAVTLHTKLIKYWHEVPKESHNELKQKLLEMIVSFGGGPKIVLDRLCISLSAFIVHMLNAWPSAIEDIVNIFQNQHLPNLTENTQMWIMMQILCGIPEEANNIYTSVARVNLRAEINKRTSFIVNTVNRYIEMKCDISLNGDDMTTMLKAVQCVGSWFKNGGLPLDNCQFIVNSVLKLVNKCYWHSTEGDGCMSAEANELAEACMDTLQGIMIQPEANRFPNSALVLMRMFLETLSPITKAEWKENNLNEDIAVGIYNLLISSIECHSRLLLSGLATESEEHKQLYVQLIQQVLECTDKPGIYPVEESCSNLALGFWYMLQDEILSMDNAEQQKTYLEIIKPLYSHLTKILVRKSQQPNENQLERWSLDDFESFRCYRQDIADSLVYCYEVLNDDILDIFYSLFQESIVLVQNDINDWPKLEACIFAFCAVAEHVLPIEKKILPKVITILAEIPYKKFNSKVLGTVLETIGAYSEWFKENPDYIQPAIQLLVKGLNSSKASQATLGLKDLTRECQKEMKIFAEPLLDACQQLLAGGQLKSSEAVRLMFSVGKLMSMLPPDKITICLDSFVSPCFEEMYRIVETPNTTESSKIRIVFCLQMISTLFSSLNINSNDETVTASSSSFSQQQQPIQPVLVVMQKTMPILKKVGEVFLDDEAIVKALCSALKYAIVNLVNDFMPMLPDVSILILQLFNQAKNCAPAMEITRICIISYYREAAYTHTMQELFYGITQATFKQYDQTPDGHHSDVTELFESFYGMNAHIVKKLPMTYSDTNIDCTKLIAYAIKSITLPENGPIKYGTQFLTHFILQSRNYPNMMQAVMNQGEDIVRTTLMCIGNHSPRTQVDIFADIFLAINKKYPREFIVWLKVLEVHNFPTGYLTMEEKLLFMKAIIREKVNKRLIQGQIREFSAKSRGIAERV